MTSSPYIVFTNFSQGGYVNYIRIVINANGAISYDMTIGLSYIPAYSGNGPLITSRFAPSEFKFNDSPYIVWIE